MGPLDEDKYEFYPLYVTSIFSRDLFLVYPFKHFVIFLYFGFWFLDLANCYLEVPSVIPASWFGSSSFDPFRSCELDSAQPHLNIWITSF